MQALQHCYTHDGDNDVACDALHDDDDDVSPCVADAVCAALEDEAENACGALHDVDAVTLWAEHPTLRILQL
ncbi:hypothetical protein BW716_18635 [[Flexibacter] sp. ATCC 35208]|nr:hypothetical protein BW716_18635 [[Flexibacter] sp. ATCC 35208]